MHKLYLNQNILTPTRLPASPVINAMRDGINLLHALSPEMCKKTKTGFVRFQQIPTHLQVRVRSGRKTAVPRRGSWAFMPLSTKAGRTRSGVEWVS